MYKMKKTAVILLLFFYLPAICGVAINFRFCCGKFTSASIHLQADNPGSPSQHKKGCCGNFSQFIKVHDAQEAAVANASCKCPILVAPILSPVIDDITLSGSGNITINTFSLHSPPFRTTQPLFLRNEVFLI